MNTFEPTINGLTSGAICSSMQAANQIQPINEIERINHRVDDMIARSNHLTGVLADIADRLFGSRPESTGNDAACQPCRSGGLGDVQGGLDRLSNALDTAASQADRLTSL